MRKRWFLILFASALIEIEFPVQSRALQVQTLNAAVAENHARQVTIRSCWGGLGPRADATIFITRSKDAYKRDGQSIDPALVDALVTALRSALIPQPDPSQLGITQSWLTAHATSQQPHSNSDPGVPTPGQLSLFQQSFTDMKLIARVLPELFKNWHSDDYPGARIEIVLEDNSRLVAYSNSQFAYMLPWNIGAEKQETYNPSISHAVAALLPPKTVNKDRLADDDLASELSEAVMGEIETAFDLRGVEDRVGADLARLRAKYQVTSATIDPWLRPEYGPDKFDPDHPEVNLHVILSKASFPPNVSDEVTLQEIASRVQGIDGFLASAGKYEDLVFSVPWLEQYLIAHPKVWVRITYVHNSSFGTDAARRFAADMKKRERNDLAQMGIAERDQIALIQVGVKYAESYWLVFPDKHMVLWRYQGPGGLLKWSPSDFGEGRCADEGINNGGCSGRGVAPDGTLVPEGTPRDVACVHAWRTRHPQPSAVPGALFDVMEHGRGGYIDLSGKVVIPLCFDDVGEFSEGLARFERDGRWGYLDLAGNIAIQPQFPWAEDFREGLAHVQASGEALGYNGRWGYINKAGEIVIAPDAKRMIDDEDGIETAFHDGLAMVEVDGEIPPRKGFIDKSGKVVIPARFTYVYPFSEGLAAATESESGDAGWGFIDKTGKWVVPQNYAWASNFQSGVAPVDNKKNCAYIDKTGTITLSMPAPGGKKSCTMAWGDFNEGLSRWLFGQKYGFIDRTGKTLINPQFDLTEGFSEGLAAVEIGKKWGYIDATGKMVIAPQDWSSAKPFHNGLAQVVTHGRWGYIDKTGKYVWGPRTQGDD
jgi:hypothetical protein